MSNKTSVLFFFFFLQLLFKSSLPKKRKILTYFFRKMFLSSMKKFNYFGINKSVVLSLKIFLIYGILRRGNVISLARKRRIANNWD